MGKTFESNGHLTISDYFKSYHGEDLPEKIPKNTEIKNPFIYGLKESVKFFKENMHQPITIIGDYDCDGICATAILAIGLKRIGLDPKTRIPRRFSEGYGLSEKIIDEIDEGLIITVDNGIKAIKAIQKAKEKGLKVIVTDHHLRATCSSTSLKR